MSALLRVRRGVAVGRVVAAADLAATQADPEMKPWVADLQALLAALHGLGELGDLDLIEVGAGGHSAPPSLLLGLAEGSRNDLGELAPVPDEALAVDEEGGCAGHAGARPTCDVLFDRLTETVIVEGCL